MRKPNLPKKYHYLNATGALHYNMTNDYMFRMVLQRDKKTLIKLISSILGISLSEIKDVKIENPIEVGKTISDKEYQLDILVLLNDDTYINIEMQVENYNNWPMRSLSYLCRRFDNATRGQDYNLIKPVYHIGFIDFTLFDDHPEFFAKYQVRNAKDSYLYTNNFNLYVIELNHTDIATSEDKASHVDIWAKLFKATTWEEVKMITKDNPSMNSTAESIFMSNADISILEQCRAREDAIAHEKYQKKLIENLNAQLDDANTTITAQKATITEMNATIADLKAKLEAYEYQKK
jgi:predicted transposase/invertase (TIGR01784 family)